MNKKTHKYIHACTYRGVWLFDSGVYHAGNRQNIFLALHVLQTHVKYRYSQK
jgi:hypothetical protein